MRVNISEVIEAHNQYESQVTNVTTALNDTANNLLNLANLDGFTGKLANNVRTYINEVDLNAIKLLLMEYFQLDRAFKSAIRTFGVDVDSDESAIVDSDVLDDILSALSKSEVERLAIQLEADAAIMTASVIADVSIPKNESVDVDNAMQDAMKLVKDQKQDLENFDGMLQIAKITGEINLVGSKLVNPTLAQAESVQNNTFTSNDLKKSTTKEGRRLTKLRDEGFGKVGAEAVAVNVLKKLKSAYDKTNSTLKKYGIDQHFDLKPKKLEISDWTDVAVEKVTSYFEAVDTDSVVKLAEKSAVKVANGIASYTVRGVVDASIPFGGKLIGYSIDYSILKADGKSNQAAMDEANAHVLIGQLTESSLVAIGAETGAEVGFTVGSIDPGIGNGFGAVGGGGTGAVLGDLSASGVAWSLDNEYDELYDSGKIKEAQEFLDKISREDQTGSSAQKNERPVATDVIENDKKMMNNPELYGTDNN